MLHIYPELKGKRIIIGITGGISAYKTCYIVRSLRKSGAEVKVVMSENATKFVSPQTFQTLSKNKVYIELFSSDFVEEPLHIHLSDWGDAFLIAPATADVIGKMASGIADNLLTTLFLSFKKKIVISPAMDEVMWKNPLVQGNIKKLSKIGVEIIEPEIGELASGKIGEGRMADEERIIFHLRKVFSKHDLKGKNFLITAGPTREYLDDIRFLTNPSSGKMGYYLAEEMALRGGKVTLLSGPVNLDAPFDVEKIDVESVEDLRKGVLENFSDCDVLIMTSAVGDFQIEKRKKGKIKRDKKITLKFIPTPDILKEVSKRKGDKIIVGFSAETEKLKERSKKKLKEKGVDIIVGSLIKKNISGFGLEKMEGCIISRNRVRNYPLIEKRKLAKMVIEEIIELVKK